MFIDAIPSLKAKALVTGSVALALALLVPPMASSVWALNDPTTCFKTAQAVALGELRDLIPGTQCSGGPNFGANCATDADCPQAACSLGDTPINSPAIKVQGETIYYEGNLDFSPATGACGYEGGKICIDIPGSGCPGSNPPVTPFRCIGGTTPGAPCPPDGPACGGAGVCAPIFGAECCDVTPTMGVPLICVGCTSNPQVSGIVSRQVPYVVNFADKTSLCADPANVRGVFNYFNGISHHGAGDEFPVDSTQPICNPVVTPTATSTASVTPTPTPTPTAPLHFSCYEAHHGPFQKQTVSLVDEFGATTGTVNTPKRLCNPADKNHEDPTAPTNPNHLLAYKVRLSPPFTGRQGVVVTNQFGVLSVDLAKPDYLFVPSAKSTTAPPMPIVPGIDHYTCYSVRRARFTQQGISIDDQFTSLVLDLKKPVRLCAPVDKNSEGIKNPAVHLLCYKVRPSRGTTPFRGLNDVFVNNQFGPDTLDIRGVRELCVPSTVMIP